MTHIDIAFHRCLKEARRWDDFAGLERKTCAGVIETLRRCSRLGLETGNGAADEAGQAVAELSGQPWLAELGADAVRRFLGSRD